MSSTVEIAQGHRKAAAGVAPGLKPELSNEQIAAGLVARIGREQVLSRLIERTLKAGDASIYRLVPRVVVLPRDVADVKAVLDYCRQNGLYLTFRAAGTSLSGQAVTDGILVDVSRGWKGLRITNEGRRVAVEPGVIASHVNAFLAPHRSKIGPDPASINACMMGGVAANNASGMCCGVRFNSYHTMHSMKLVLADGLEINTADHGANDQLREARPNLYNGLLRIRERIQSDRVLAERVERKFSIKNTCGYSMNAFTDFEQPIDILSHLLIGSEGTLGFIAEITLNTLPDLPVKATSLVYFADLVDAGRVIKPLSDAGAAVLEIMDRASMASVEDEMDYPFTLAGRAEQPVSTPDEFAEAKADTRASGEGREPLSDFPAGAPPALEKPVVSGNCAALLIEFQGDSEGAIQLQLEAAAEILGRFKLLAPVTFTRDPARQADYWHMRKGLFPSVGAMREIGTAVIIEDVCVQPQFLADAIQDIQAMFVKYDFPDAIIFGHAKDGNIHFVICTDFADQAQVTRYAELMDELTAVIVQRYDGSLKAEHGTGRNIAPFVEREWGEQLYQFMWQVKQLLDPDNLLSPGVVLNRDPQAHLKHLKVMPAVSPVVDKCIECGFCEPRCPSRDLTTTPRQRIVILREIERLLKLGDGESVSTAEELRSEYEYYGNATCATDGMCATACPVKINTGEMIKDLRHAEHPAMAKKVAAVMARNFGLLSKGAWAGLTAIRLGGPVSLGVARMGAELGFRLSGGKLPRLPKRIPVPGPAPALPRPKINPKATVQNSVVYFPTCLTRSLGSLPGEKTAVGLAEAVVTVLEKCGWNATIPAHIGNFCCGQPFFSKGFYEAGSIAAARTVNALWEETQHGAIPVLCDTSPCSGQFGQCDKYLQGEALARWKKLKIIDLPTFIAREVIPTRSDWPKLTRKAVLHPTCTLMKLGGLPDLRKVANTFACDVEVPVLAECCGFAGDRGFLFPELTLSATRPESDEVCRNMKVGESSRCYSTCRTCEIGMMAGTGEVYSSIIHLVYDALMQS